MAGQKECVYIQYKPNRCVIFLSFSGQPSTQECYLKIRAIVNHLVQVLKEYLALCIHIGVSSPLYTMQLCSNSSQQMTVCPFIRDRITGQYIKLEKAALHLSDPLQNTQNDKFQKLEFQIPTYEDILIEEIGWEFYAPIDNNMGPFTVFLDDVEIIQNPNYMIHFDKLPMERWNVLHTCVAGLTWLRGKVELEDGWLAVSGCSAPAEAYTGEIHWKNYRFQSIIRPGKGDTHRILFRVQGAMRCYAAGFMKDNRLVLWKKEKDYRVLCQCPFTWESNKEYKLTVEVNGNKTVIYVNDHAYLEWEDKENAYNEGCIGFGTEGSSRTFFKEYEICMLE